MSLVVVTIKVPDDSLKEAEALMEPMSRAGAILTPSGARDRVSRTAVVRVAIDRSWLNDP